MLFAPDIAVYEQRVRDRVGEPVASRLRFFTHGQHNHEGPDTSGLGGPVNREYFDYMFEAMTQVTAEAIERLEPANLFFGETKHAFGLGDGRDPLIYDRTVHVLRAYAASNDSSPLVSIVQWGMHPEVTLGYRPTVPDADCLALGREVGCSARGEFFTADYPGNFARILKRTRRCRPVRTCVETGTDVCRAPPPPAKKKCAGRERPHRTGRQRRGRLL